ncbi:unnamed protein product, partial [Soboliphyme baturini]|uniref:TIP120 domain-containing protein n=1 Tax=Soboliphyme baturini TaxID=241478 RepID=A0A183J947_9BILA
MLPLFEKLASAGIDDSESSAESSDENTLQKSLEPVMTFIDCRQYAASVLPILTKLIDMDNFKKILLPLYKRLCQDLDGEVQRLAAFTFHEVASRLADEAPQMIDSFIDLVYSGDAD